MCISSPTIPFILLYKLHKTVQPFKWCAKENLKATITPLFFSFKQIFLYIFKELDHKWGKLICKCSLEHKSHIILRTNEKII